MSGRDVQRLLGMGSTRRAGASATPDPVLRDGIVTRVDPDGALWVTPTDGGDARAPLGPCRGGRRVVLVLAGTGTPSDANATYRLQNAPLPLRSEVVFTVTPRGVWIVAADPTTGRTP